MGPVSKNIDTTGLCPECERLLVAYLSATRETRIMLEAVAQARQAGVLDDVGFLVADAQLESSLSNLRQAQQAYGRHRQERH